MGKRYEGQNKREKETNEQLSKRDNCVSSRVKLFLINSGEKKSIEKTQTFRSEDNPRKNWRF